MLQVDEATWFELESSLRRSLRARVANAALVEDAIQETFLKLHDRIDTLRDEERFGPWVHRIAHRTLIDLLRREAVRSRPLPPEDDGPPEENLNQEVGEWLHKFIELLPETYREAVRLSEVEGLTQQEVADRLGLSLSGAKSRVQRGRAKLKQALLACCHIEFDRHGNVLDARPHQTRCDGC